MDANFIKINTKEDFLKWKSNQCIYEENGIKFPVLNAVLVHKSMILPNDYNPNHVAKDKMELLKTSIVENGFAFGIVAIFDYDIDKFVIIDGYHRDVITGKKWLDLTYKPLVILDHSMEKRLAATVQFNKARGVHKIDLNAELVKRMVELGMEDYDICKQLGIDADEFLRLKRNVKIAEIYKDLEFSNSWEVGD
ncbi:ParB N-terminal domain-containing protein [Capnocytophaga canimorsus]|uniref:ParB N-terminal domain-containing protein n=1 Tax=Capnocytophaga canimorsus TaxID=28188 RepID=UPI0037D71525